MKALTLMVSLSLCLIASTGCDAGDDESDFDADAPHDEELAETADAFTGSYGVSLTSTGSLAYSSVNLGSNNWQSFFTSIQGNLSRGGQDAYVATRVYSGGDFDLEVQSGASTKTLSAEAWAYTPGNYSTTQHSCGTTNGNTQTVALTPPAGAASYRCFITRVLNSTGTSFQSSTDQAYVLQSAGGASLTCLNDAQARATCIPVTNVLAGYDVNGPTDFYTNVNTASGRTCLLNKVSGTWNSNTGGAKAYVKNGNQWWFKVDTGKGAAITCIE